MICVHVQQSELWSKRLLPPQPESFNPQNRGTNDAESQREEVVGAARHAVQEHVGDKHSGQPDRIKQVARNQETADTREKSEKPNFDFFLQKIVTRRLLRDESKILQLLQMVDRNAGAREAQRPLNCPHSIPMIGSPKEMPINAQSFTLQLRFDDCEVRRRVSRHLNPSKPHLSRSTPYKIWHAQRGPSRGQRKPSHQHPPKMHAHPKSLRPPRRSVDVQISHPSTLRDLALAADIANSLIVRFMTPRTEPR